MPIPQSQLMELIAITDAIASRVETLMLSLPYVEQKNAGLVERAIHMPTAEERQIYVLQMHENLLDLIQAIKECDITKDEIEVIAVRRDYFRRNAKKNEASARWQRNRRLMAISRAGEPRAEELVQMMQSPASAPSAELEIPPSAGYLDWKNQYEPKAEPKALLRPPPSSGPKIKPSFDMSPDARELYEQQQREDAEHAANSTGDVL